MIRIGAFAFGLFITAWLLISAAMGSYTMVTEPEPATAEEEFHLHPKHPGFSFEGPLGRFDQAQLQRGLQVYKEVCAACHSLNRVAFRDFEGLGYTPGQVKTIATEWLIETPDVNPETGEAITRKSIAADKLPSPYPNEVAARAANNNSAPPDLSLITKARHGGADYVYSLLTGYREPLTYRNEDGKMLPEDNRPGDTTHFNPYFANLNLAMPAPLAADGQVTYGEGAPQPTVKQMAKDVSAFLEWASEPKAENRKRAGLAVMLFLLIFAGLCWLSYKSIWAHKKGSGNA